MKKKRLQIISVLALGVLFVVLANVIKVRKSEEKAVQLKQVQLVDVHVGFGKIKGQHQKAVFGAIVNNGTRTIKIAKILVFFPDANNEILNEQEFFPVTPYSFIDPKPLLPGETKEFGFAIGKYAPPKWSGQVIAKVVDIQFKD